MFHVLGCFTVKVYSFEEMPKYIVHLFMLFLICFIQIWIGRRMSSNGLIEMPECAKVKRRVPLALGRSGWRKTRMFQRLESAWTRG